MSNLDELKSEAEKAVQKQEGWIKANRKPLIIGAAVVLLVVVLSHFL